MHHLLQVLAIMMKVNFTEKVLFYPCILKMEVLGMARLVFIGFLFLFQIIFVLLW